MQLPAPCRVLLAVLYVGALAAPGEVQQHLRRASSSPSQPAEAALLATDTKRGKDVPKGMGPPRPFGRTFLDAPIGNTDWVNHGKKIFVIGDMDPTAPMDRLDGTDHSSATGAMPTEPGSVSVMEDQSIPMTPDYMPATRIRQRVFPQQPPRGNSGTGAGGGIDNPAGASPIIDLDKRRLIGKPDRLRPERGPPVADSLKQAISDPADNYPLAAPMDRLPDGAPEAVAPVDAIPKYVSRYLEQRVTLDQERLNEKQFVEEWARVDSNLDGVVSRGEFSDELRGRQQKTQEETERLWEKYHQSENKFMIKEEFRRLARTGYDLGTIARTDVSSVLSPPTMKGLGFWGAGATCPSGTYVVGAKLKVMKSSRDPSVDDTGVNGVKFRCSDDTEVSTVKGPDGDWTEWEECPKGQVIYSFRSQGLQPRSGLDNAGIRGLQFSCRKPDLSEVSRLHFGAKLNVALPWEAAAETSEGDAEEDSTEVGGWSKAMRCAPRESVCGAQANLVKDRKDNMGVADIRVYCCNSPVDCTDVCTEAYTGIKLVKCRACRGAQGIKPDGFKDGIGDA